MQIKLKSKLILPTLCLFAMALLISNWYAYIVAKDELQKSVLETLFAYTKGLAFYLDDAAANIGQDIKGTSVIPPVMAIMSIQQQKDTIKYSKLQEELNYSMHNKTMVINNIYQSIEIINNYGEIIASNNPDNIGVYIEVTTAYLKSMQERNLQISPPYSRLPQETLVAFYVPIILHDQVVGCIRAVINFNLLSEQYVSRIKLESGYPFIVGPEGIIMYHPTKEFIMDPIKPEDLDLPAHTMSVMRNGSLQYIWNNAPWMAIFQTGAITNWTAIVKVNLNILFKPIYIVQTQILYMSLIWLVLFGLLMFLISHKIVTAILKTIEYARQVANGALEQELHFYSNDEVGILADSLRSMVSSLKTMIAHSIEQQNELVQISQHKTDFLANMSHEIRTPMNAIMGFTTLFRKDNLDEKQISYLDKISIASKSMLQIVNDVLDLSKIEKGKLSIEKISFSLHEMIKAVSGVIEFSAQTKDCEFKLFIDEGLPDVVLGDPARIQQVLFNLLGNAIKFTQKGTVFLNVTQQPRSKEDTSKVIYLLFEVRDTGIGITEDNLQSLFNPFVQADSSIARRFGGTGLGLTISKRLIELMGGQISVESKLGEGSTFRFTIKTIGSEQTKSAFRFTETKWQTTKLYGFQVLVVEDNEINQEIICAMLDTLGIEDITVASNGQEAIEIALKHEFDIILMDMQMPVMDGVTAAQRLRVLGNTVPYLEFVPIIALTANALSIDVKKCMEAGMNAHISKPIMLDVLASVLERFLQITPGN